MRILAPDSDLTLSSRFECKYVVDPRILPRLRQFIAPFMRADRFSARRLDGRYPVCSLYLDTDDLRLYGQTVAGEKRRFKLRARSYSDDADAPVFLEIKRKIDNIVRKRRARLERADAIALLDRLPGIHAAFGFPPESSEFALLAARASARPVVRVRYMREAYESAAGDPVRITIDTELCHAVTLRPEVSVTRGRFVPTPSEGAILEIKFTELFPAWVRDLVREFGLKQRPVPKYVMSVDALLAAGPTAPLTLAGRTIASGRP